MITEYIETAKGFSKRVINPETIKFVINGLIATAVHYSVLVLCVEIIKLDSMFISDFFAAVCGIVVSFIGNKYFVFKNKRHDLLFKQALMFVLLYGVLALIHSGIVNFMVNVLFVDYRYSFIAATVVQVSLSYFGNKLMVFKHE